jgi:microcystin-dependent protein
LLFCSGAAEQVANATQSQHALTLGQATTLLSQPGKVDWFAIMSPPAGFLAANGAAVSRVTFATLFNAITAQPTGTVTSGSNSISSVASPQAMWVGMPISGPGIPAGATITAVGGSTITLSANATATSTTTVVICPFGVGDGSTTFNVPEMRARVARGWDNGANVDTGRVFGSYQADAYPSHNHSLPGAGSFFTTAASGGSTTLANWSAGSTGVSGSGSETRVKSTALLACIKY